MKNTKYFMLLVITLSMLFGGIAFNHGGEGEEHNRTIYICLQDITKILSIDPIPVAGKIAELCPECPSDSKDIEWEIRVSDAVFESLMLVPVNLRKPAEALKLNGLEPAAGGLRLTGQQATISGLEADKSGDSGAFRPMARFHKGTRAGQYSLEILQRVAGESKIIRKDLFRFVFKECPQNLGDCERNPITSELLQHVYAKHSPIYPRAGEVVTYTASARGKIAENIGVDKIEIEVTQMEYSVNQNQLVLIDITSVDTHTTMQSFPDHPMDAEVALRVGPFPENTWVKYEAKATLEDGTVLTDLNIRHAANWTNKTLISLAKGALPIYKRGKSEDKFDFLFVPDVDYGTDESAYISDVENIIYENMFTDPPYRWKRFRRYMNIYMNMFKPHLMGDANGFDADEVLADKPDNFDGLNSDDEEGNRSDLTNIDVAVIVHQTAQQDWAFLGLMEGKFCSAERGEVINMEGLHALMKLKDEYAGERSQPDIAHPNIFDSQEACEKHVAEHPGFSPGHCEQGPGDSTFWHWCDSYQESIGINVHVMDTNGAGPFMVEERCQLAWAVDNLLGDPAGSAYGKMWVYGCDGFPCVSTKPSAATQKEVEKAQLAEEDTAIDQDGKGSETELENQPRGKKTLILSLLLDKDGAVLRQASVGIGPAPNLGTATVYKGREQEAPFQVQLLKTGRVIKAFGISDPRLMAAEGGKVQPAPRSQVDWNIRLPLDNIKKIDRIKIVDNQQQIFLDRKIKIVN